MTNKDILNAYLKGTGMKILKGDTTDFSPFLPFVLMDLVFDQYRLYIKPMNLKQKSQKARTDWVEAYNYFNKRFFAYFDDDQKCYIIDKMQHFDDHIANELAIVRSQFSNQCKMLEFEQQKEAVAILVCGMLVEAAIVNWKSTYKHGDETTGNPLLTRIQRDIETIRENYKTDGFDINVNVSDDCILAVRALCRKIIDWLNVA